MTAPVVVVGSGFGGLATAVRLRALGHEVVVLEANEGHGGRAAVFRRGGRSYDAGPTVITAPHLFSELFTLLGRDPNDFYELLPVDPFYRVSFPDGESFDYVGDEERLTEQVRRLSPGDVDGFRRLSAHARDVFDVGYGLVDAPFDRLTDMAKVVPSMARLRSDRSVFDVVSRHVRDERLRQVFSFEPLLIGGNPTVASSLYLLIHALERKWGVWYARGGTGALVAAIVRLLEESGVELRTGAAVEEIELDGRRVTGVRLASGERVAASAVVWNGDPGWVYRTLPPHLRTSHPDRRLDRRRSSMSLFVAYFGTRRRYPSVAHHTIVLGPRYEGLLDDIFVHRRLSDDCSIYLHRPAATDPTAASPDEDSFYALVPVPNLQGGADWSQEAPRLWDRVVDALERGPLPGLRENVVDPFFVDPRYFEQTLRSVDGAAFGLEPTLAQSAYFRYHNRAEDIDGLWFVGQGTHPGAGLPGVLSSAKVVERGFRASAPPAKQVLARRAHTFAAAARWLDASVYEDLATVYAFCRAVDDHADETPDPRWIERVDRQLRAGVGTVPEVTAFLDVARRRDLPLDLALELVAGVRGDLGRVRIADDAELLHYAFRVAGTVGGLLAPLLGAPADARDAAVDLGIAMQLTNVCRDVAEDARLDRVYLPASRLEARGVDPEDLVRGTADPVAVAAVVADVLALAEARYTRGFAGAASLPWRSRLAVVHAASRYRAIGRAVRARGPAAVADRTVLGWWPKLALALATPIRAWRAA